MCWTAIHFHFDNKMYIHQYTQTNEKKNAKKIKERWKTKKKNPTTDDVHIRKAHNEMKIIMERKGVWDRDIVQRRCRKKK